MEMQNDADDVQAFCEVRALSYIGHGILTT